jgi:hypothetical protein
MRRSSVVWMAAGLGAAMGLGVAFADAAGGPATSTAERIALARSAAPADIAKGARVMDMDAEGKMVELAPGTNGFTCMPDDPSTPIADPMCMDPAAFQWASDLISGKPKPTNTAPGFAYMARGGEHYEKDGAILMQNAEGAKLVKEPPHWMLFWPFSAAATGLPSLPQGDKGTYVMWDGTPYAHLMVYQDPNKMK